jgi:hypothetical protein
MLSLFANSKFYGGDGNDTLISQGGGFDVFSGGAGQDIFDFMIDASDNPTIKVITDFNLKEGDVLKLTDIIEFMDLGDPISDFIRFTESNGRTFLQTSKIGDFFGDGSSFETIARLDGVTNFIQGNISTEAELNALIASNTLILA